MAETIEKRQKEALSKISLVEISSQGLRDNLFEDFSMLYIQVKYKYALSFGCFL